MASFSLQQQAPESQAPSPEFLHLFDNIEGKKFRVVVDWFNDPNNKELMQSSLCAQDKSERHDSLLHRAVHARSKELVHLLLRKRAPPDILNASNQTPLHYAARLGEKEICDLLLRYGAQPLMRDARKKTPIDLANITNPHLGALLERAAANTNRNQSVPQAAQAHHERHNQPRSATTSAGVSPVRASEERRGDAEINLQQERNDEGTTFESTGNGIPARLTQQQQQQQQQQPFAAASSNTRPASASRSREQKDDEKSSLVNRAGGAHGASLPNLMPLMSDNDSSSHGAQKKEGTTDALRETAFMGRGCASNNTSIPPHSRPQPLGASMNNGTTTTALEALTKEVLDCRQKNQCLVNEIGTLKATMGTLQAELGQKSAELELEERKRQEAVERCTVLEENCDALTKKTNTLSSINDELKEELQAVKIVRDQLNEQLSNAEQQRVAQEEAMNKQITQLAQDLVSRRVQQEQPEVTTELRPQASLQEEGLRSDSSAIVQQVSSTAVKPAERRHSGPPLDAPQASSEDEQALPRSALEAEITVLREKLERANKELATVTTAAREAAAGDQRATQLENSLNAANRRVRELEAELRASTRTHQDMMESNRLLIVELEGKIAERENEKKGSEPAAGGNSRDGSKHDKCTGTDPYKAPEDTRLEEVFSQLKQQHEHDVEELATLKLKLKEAEQRAFRAEQEATQLRDKHFEILHNSNAARDLQVRLERSEEHVAVLEKALKQAQTSEAQAQAKRAELGKAVVQLQSERDDIKHKLDKASTYSVEVSTTLRHRIEELERSLNRKEEEKHQATGDVPKDDAAPTTSGATSRQQQEQERSGLIATSSSHAPDARLRNASRDFTTLNIVELEARRLREQIAELKEQHKSEIRHLKEQQQELEKQHGKHITAQEETYMQLAKDKQAVEAKLRQAIEQKEVVEMNAQRERELLTLEVKGSDLRQKRLTRELDEECKRAGNLQRALDRLRAQHYDMLSQEQEGSVNDATRRTDSRNELEVPTAAVSPHGSEHSSTVDTNAPGSVSRALATTAADTAAVPREQLPLNPCHHDLDRRRQHPALLLFEDIKKATAASNSDTATASSTTSVPPVIPNAPQQRRSRQLGSPGRATRLQQQQTTQEGSANRLCNDDDIPDDDTESVDENTTALTRPPLGRAPVAQQQRLIMPLRDARSFLSSGINDANRRRPMSAQVRANPVAEFSFPTVYVPEIDILSLQPLANTLRALPSTKDPLLFYQQVCQIHTAPVNAHVEQRLPSIARSMSSSREVMSRLHTLDLSGLHLGRRGARSVIDLLVVLPNLHVLNLTSNALDAESCVYLYEHAVQHPTLTEIVLENNRISKVGARTMLALAHRNPRITRIALAYNSLLMPEIIAQIEEACRNNLKNKGSAPRAQEQQY